MSPIDYIEVIVGQSAPLLLGSALELLPVPFDSIPAPGCPGILDESCWRTARLWSFVSEPVVKGSAALDAGLIAAAQAVEHYEISRYGTLKAWAEQLGLQQAVSLLDETLEEEKKTDEALTELAKAAVNQEAQQAAE